MGRLGNEDRHKANRHSASRQKVNACKPQVRTNLCNRIHALACDMKCMLYSRQTFQTFQPVFDSPDCNLDVEIIYQCITIVCRMLHSSAQGSAGVHGRSCHHCPCSLWGSSSLVPRPPQSGNETRVVAALLQYFMLVFFGWTAVEALFLHQKLVRSHS